jgi:hypothetical protein
MPDTAITTTKTIAKRLSRLPIKSLPRTFQDAIIATRKLKSQYLWVDSLCILQDSPSDWQQESARMGKVYSHSFCMIAAAASPDSNGGIFPLRSELPILGAADPVMPSRLVVLKKSFTSSGWSGLFRSSGLNYRGWTLQERELSPRILYFTKHTILFECKESRAGNPEKLRRSIELTSKEDLELHPQVRRCLDRFYRKDHGRGQYTEYKGRRYDFWFDMIEGYSTRQLSMKTDKFPGISGLASEYAYQLNDQYVAGLWRNDLCRGLSWRLLKKGSTKFSRKQARSVNTETSIYGPSWSWAKMDHPVSYEIVRRKDKFLDGPIDQGLLFKNPEILEIFVVPEGKDPNGTLISASIHLYGQLLTTYISRLGTCNIWGESVPISWDSLPQTLPKRSVIHLLNLSNTGSALVLTFVPRLPTELEHPGARRFKRIGIVPTIDRRWFQEFEMEEMVLI